VEAPRTEPFRVASGLVFVTVEAAGSKLLALLDTGASASAIDPRRAKGLEVVGRGDVVGTTGTMQAETVRLGGLSLGGTPLPELRATRRDLAGLLAPRGERVDLILGADALAGRVLSIDFVANQLVLLEPAAADPGGIPMRLDNGIPTLAADLAGERLELRLDTGASLFETQDVYVNVPTRVWQALCRRHPGLAPSSQLQGTGADGRTVALPVARVGPARIGPRSLAEVFVIVQPEAGYFAAPDALGFVSNNFLATLGRVELDFANRRMRTR